MFPTTTTAAKVPTGAESPERAAALRALRQLDGLAIKARIAMASRDGATVCAVAEMAGAVTTAAVPGLRTRDRVRSIDGDLTVVAVDYGHADADDVIAGRAPALGCQLTEDARTANTREWHEGPDAGADRWIRYERWSVSGRQGHGYVDPTSRKLVQTG